MNLVLEHQPIVLKGSGDENKDIIEFSEQVYGQNGNCVAMEVFIVASCCINELPMRNSLGFKSLNIYMSVNI